jgi:hypothetical protein
MIQETSNMTVQTGNGSTTEAYPIPFRFDEPGWLRVTLRRRSAPADGEETRLEPGTGYTVDMVDGHARLFTTEPVGADMQIRIRRRTPRTQRLHPLPATPLAPEDVERALDRVAMAVQDLRTDGGISTRSMTFPASEVVESGGVTLRPHQATGGEPDRRGTVITFFPENPPGAPAPENEPPGGLTYTPTDALLESIREQAEGDYLIDLWGTAEYTIEGAVSWLTARADAYRFSIQYMIANQRHGTTFGYKGRSAYTAPASLTIQHGSVGEFEMTEPHAQSFRSTVIGHGAHTDQGDDDENTRDMLVIGAESRALRNPDQHHSLAVAGSSALIYGYNNVALGSQGITGRADAQDALFQDHMDWTGHIYSTVVGTANFCHGRENVILGAQAVVHGKRNCAFGHQSVANGYGMLALGADATAQVPYAEHRPSLESPPPDAAALAVGHGAHALSWETVAAGASAEAATAPQTVAVGAGAVAGEEGCVALGHGAAAQAGWSTMFSNGMAENGAWAASGFGYRSRLTLEGSVEVIARGQGDDTPPGRQVPPGARAFLHPHHGLSLSHAATALPPAATAAGRGTEPQAITAEHCGTLAPGMLAFHCDGDTLRIHLCDGPVIRTASADFGVA